MKKQQKDDIIKILENEKILLEADIKACNEHSDNFNRKMARIFESL